MCSILEIVLCDNVIRWFYIFNAHAKYVTNYNI